MNRKLTIILPIATIIALSSLKADAQSKENMNGGFPLSKGSYWIYSGVIESRENQQDCNTPDSLVKRTVTWKMEVVETIDRGHIAATLVKGHPYDAIGVLDNEKFELKRADYLIIQDEKERLYLLPNDESAEDETGPYYEMLKRLWDKEDSLEGLIGRFEPELEFPLAVGKVIGGSPEHLPIGRWVVEAENKTKMKGVKGIKPSREVKEYRMALRGNSGERRMAFVPGIGITEFGVTFRPAGCLMLEADIKLVEYSRGK